MDVVLQALLHEAGRKSRDEKRAELKKVYIHSVMKKGDLLSLQEEQFQLMAVIACLRTKNASAAFLFVEL